ncbi:MAG: hypothetical protein LBK82_13485, partial [Planctomycetaceae bacterium]|nr:hypothetical protein [Planctomycetaceae bacterium]
MSATTLPISPPPPILTSSLTSKISFVRKKSFPTKSFWAIFIKVVAASLLISCLLGQNVNATTYHVGTDQTPYTNLEVLRTTSGLTWYDGDEIILHNDDSSLTAAFNFNGKKITIDGNAKISPNGSNFRFLSSST